MVYWVWVPKLPWNRKQQNDPHFTTRVVTWYTQNRWDSYVFSYTFHLGEMFYFDITHSAEWKQKFSSNNLWWSFISPNNDQPVYTCISNTGNPWRALVCDRLIDSNLKKNRAWWAHVGNLLKMPKQSSARAGRSSTAQAFEVALLHFVYCLHWSYMDIYIYMVVSWHVMGHLTIMSHLSHGPWRILLDIWYIYIQIQKDEFK